MNKPIDRWILATAAGLAPSTGAIASTQVPHRSGGVSVEEIAELRRHVSDYSLELVLAARDTLTRVIQVPRSGLARSVIYFGTGDEVSAESPSAYRLN